MALKPVHVIGDVGVGDDLTEREYGDVRDVIVAAPNFGGHGYAIMDLFPIRHKIIQELDPAPTSVFEFGSLLGYFLLTAVDAAPITRVGWIDSELDYPGSNMACWENLEDYFAKNHRSADLWYDTVTRRCTNFGHADLVQVDGAHSYPDCMTDLIWAMELRPQTIFVDDYTAIEGVKYATDKFARWKRLEVEVHETVNGLAVLRL